MFQVTQEIMHQVALLPLIAMLTLVRSGAFTTQQWLISVALALSWVADATNVISGFAGIPLTEYLAPLQIALVLLALVPDRADLALVVLGLLLVALTSVLQGAPPRGIIVPTLGGLMVTAYAWRARHPGLIVYFGLGALMWGVWALAATEPTWYGYQATRLAGIFMVTAALVGHARKPYVKLV